MRVPALPEHVPRRGCATCRWVGRSMLRLFGWSVEGELPNLPKFVIAAAPHTSNWDFVMGAATMFALDLRLAFIGKHTIFVGPFGPILRWMGGLPVDRSSPHGVVSESIRAFREAGSRVLVIAPEGTRKHVPHFKAGFLHIARGAEVPVLCAAFDYAHKRLLLGPLIELGADIDADRVRIEKHFAGFEGKNPR